MRLSTNQQNIAAVLFFILTGSLLYANSLTSPFLFDDTSYVYDQNLRMESLSFDEFVNAAFGGEAKRRPVSNISLALNHLFSGDNIKGYHLVNIAIHICSTIVLFFLLQLTLCLPPNKKKYKHFRFIAFFSSAIWLVHPLATQSVTYIIQRMNSMATLFYLLSVLLYARGRKSQIDTAFRPFHISLPSWLFLGSFISGLLAIGSKEIAVTLPIILFLYEWYFLQNLELQWLKKKTPWLITIGIFLVSWVFLYLGKNPLLYILHSCDGRKFTTTERLLTELRVIVHYLSLILFPHPDRLLFDYTFPLSTSLLKPITTFYSLLTLSLLFITAVIASKKERLLSFCILWFFVNLTIESTVICVDIIYEHRTYLPSIFIILSIILIFCRVSNKRMIMTLLLVPVIIQFSCWTIERNKVWGDGLTFWNDSLKKSPEKPRVLCNIGNEYYKIKEFKKAEKYYLKSLAIDPNFRYSILNLGLTYINLKQYDDAEYYFKYGLELEPAWVDVYISLAQIYQFRKNDAEAISLLRTALHFAPQHYAANKEMGEILFRTGRPRLALFFFRKMAQYKPNDIPLLTNIGEALIKIGNTKESISIYKHILSLNPDSVTANYNLAMLLMPYDIDQALFHFRETVRLSPYSVPALYNLANILFRSGELDQAKKYYETILNLTPEFANTFNNYGLLLAEEKKYTEALPFFKKTLQILPNHQQAGLNLEITENKLQDKRNETIAPPGDNR